MAFKSINGESQAIRMLCAACLVACSTPDTAARPADMLGEDAALTSDATVADGADARDTRPEDAALADAGRGVDAAGDACVDCGPKGDWLAGDYPPSLHDQTYLPLTGVAGQNGAIRGYKLHVPPGYDPTRPTPLLFALHGLVQNAVMFAVDGAAWPAKSDAEGFLLAMPTGNAQNADGSWGVVGSWNAGECCGGAAQNKVDDVAFIRAVYADIDRHVHVDHTRVYATGLSNGGFLSYRLACEASDLFVAIAPGAGAIGTHALAPMGVGNQDFSVCEPKQPVSVLAIHGTSDPLVPFAYFQPSLAHMAEQNGCSASTIAASVPMSRGGVTCTTYSGCPSGVEVSGCSVKDGGHCWFGDATCGTGDPTGIGNGVVGANSKDIVNTDAVWAFLSRLSRAL